ncbi:TBC domain-containing protein [Cyphellophora attinorum]|uniref:TBC domain-containing protein n=1 Tax=Cyphellophora attinorum TaxID=1664694 RepID=A0A0N0NQX4_9EURO|nr:TBC domain-containing protein [Phialophora attinorum]KPI44431.1 TBC domain-containing protein [Phialophora attinorum]
MGSESQPAPFRNSLHGLPYAETVPHRQPKHGTPTSTPPPIPQSAIQNIENNDKEGSARSPVSPVSAVRSEWPDSQPKTDSIRPESERPDSQSVASPTSIPQIRIGEETSKPKKSWFTSSSNTSPKPTEDGAPSFEKLAVDLSPGSFGDEFGDDHIKFSKRGSMLVDGRKVSNSSTKPNNLAPIGDRLEQTQTDGASSSLPQTQGGLRHRPSVKVLSTDEEALSEKVRSYYAFGSEAHHDNDAASSIANRMGLRWQDALAGTNTEASSMASLSRGTSTTDIHSDPGSQQNGSRISSMQRDFLREVTELAGGIEDWNEVDSADVDRYGFIVPKPDTGPNGITRSPTTKQLTRVSTSLQLASETPRRKHTIRRSPSSARSVRSTSAAVPSSTSQSSFKRPMSAHSSNTALSRRGTFRSRDRKLMDDASDMLTLPRSASNLSTTDPYVSAADDPRARLKEVEREEKWRKMAQPVAKADQKLGGGMAFTFDTSSTKLIERTWKGIPDKWRATAWHAFLNASAKKRHGSLSDPELTTLFTEYQLSSSPDDVQIDIDVPRTISSHIMFRRRYRGGQRLLFRVLHAMSLHFPETGYVQGMAALAATLLSYYSEETAFIMLVRLWELRGLEKLYKNGFGGLMAALDDFESKWLGKGEIGKKLEEIGIPPTSYGTRWYLTLFNYSIPFPAQLRVWDVFMLLGDDTSLRPRTAKSNAIATSAPNGKQAEGTAVADSTTVDADQRFGTTLDTLHATSAALIDGMREILLESDFENGMKVLTSWVPIKDEDLFMRVARAEWKLQRKKQADK